MNRLLLPAAAATACFALPAHAEGDLGIVERGTYVCELPGDAAGAVGVEQPQESFSIESASRYSSAQGGGTYLRRGERLTMTSGPRNGDTYRIVSPGFLRKIVNGEVSRLRCVRQGG